MLYIVWDWDTDTAIDPDPDALEAIYFQSTKLHRTTECQARGPGGGGMQLIITSRPISGHLHVLYSIFYDSILLTLWTYGFAVGVSGDTR